MKTKRHNMRLNQSLTALCAAVMLLGLSTGRVLAAEVSDEDYKTLQTHKKKEAEKQLPPHLRPAPAEPGNPAKGNQHGSLAAAATNPLANLIQFQLQNKYAFDSHNSSGYANTFLIQPVVPFSLPSKKMPVLITRSTLPYVSTPDLGSPVNRRNGFGDFTFLAVGNIPIAKGQMVGVGGSLVFPTAGDNEFTGSGKYQAGPSLAYINTAIPKWQIGIFGYQHWSYASGGSSSNREDVSDLFIQPILIRHFNKGWYAGLTDDPQKYDFKANGFTWNIGARVGKVTKIGKMPINFFLQPSYNPNAAGGASETTALKFNMTLLFPK